jgi:hypothetical protein
MNQLGRRHVGPGSGRMSPFSSDLVLSCYRRRRAVRREVRLATLRGAGMLDLLASG